MLPHTDVTLGDCRYRNCTHMSTCRQIHYEREEVVGVCATLPLSIQPQFPAQVRGGREVKSE